MPRTLGQVDNELAAAVTRRAQYRVELRDRKSSVDIRKTLMVNITVTTERIEQLLEERSQLTFVEQVVSL